MTEKIEFKNEEKIQFNVITKLLQFLRLLFTLPFSVVLCIGLAILTWILGILCLILQEAPSDAFLVGTLALGGGFILLIFTLSTLYRVSLYQKISPQIISGIGGTACWLIGTTLTFLSAYETKLFGFLFEYPDSIRTHADEPFFYLKLFFAPFIILGGLVGDLAVGILTEKYFRNVFTKRHSL